MREQEQQGPWGDSEHGGPWTRHGHSIPGKTITGERRPSNVARCGGTRMCRTCQADAATAVTPTTAQPAAPGGGGDVQAALAEAFTKVRDDELPMTTDEWTSCLAAALAPVVARLCEQRAAEARTEALTSPCRYCGSRTVLDGLHVHGERKCCPDCDHRAAVEAVLADYDLGEATDRLRAAVTPTTRATDLAARGDTP